MELGVVMLAILRLQFTDIGLHHLGHQVVETRGVSPAQFVPRFAGVADEQVNFGRPEIARVDPHKRITGLGIDTLLGPALASPDDPTPDNRERPLNELSYWVRLARCENVIVRFALLHHQPHALDVVAGVPPVAL